MGSVHEKATLAHAQLTHSRLLHPILQLQHPCSLQQAKKTPPSPPAPPPPPVLSPPTLGLEDGEEPSVFDVLTSFALVGSSTGIT